MKARFFITWLVLSMIAFNSYAMWPEDFDEDDGDDEYEIEFYEENPVFVPNNSLIKIWALPEINRAKDNYVYDRTHSLAKVIENGNLLHLRDRLRRTGSIEIDEGDAEGNTPLHIAARCLEYNKVDCLLREGANPDVINNENQNPADLMPPIHLDVSAPITSIMQPHFVIQAMLVAKSNNQNYDLIISEDGLLRL